MADTRPDTLYLDTRFLYPSTGQVSDWRHGSMAGAGSAEVGGSEPPVASGWLMKKGEANMLGQHNWSE